METEGKEAEVTHANQDKIPLSADTWGPALLATSQSPGTKTVWEGA